MSLFQCCVCIFLIVPAYKISMLPSYFCTLAGRDAWLSVGVFLLVDVLTFFAVVVVQRRGGLGEMIEKSLGKTARKIVIFALSLYLLVRMAVQCHDAIHYMITVMFDHNEKLAITIPFVLVALFVGVKDGKTLGRLATTVFFIMVFSVVTTVITNEAPVDFKNLFPTLSGDVADKLTAGRHTLIWFGDFLPFMMIKTDFKKGKAQFFVTLSAFLSAVAVVFVYAVHTGLFGEAAQYVPDAYERIVRYNVIGGNVGRLDVVGIMVWLCAVILNSAVTVNAAFWSVKDVTSQAFTPYLTVLCGAVHFAVAMLCDNVETVFRYGDLAFYPAIVMQYALPLFLIFFALAKEKKKASGNLLRNGFENVERCKQ